MAASGGERAHDVLSFWVGGEIKERYHRLWFPDKNQQKETDSLIHAQFSNLLTRAENGELESWKSAPSSCVALVIVLDQFSRHIYRNRPNREDIDRNDKLALATTNHFLDTMGWDPAALLTVPEHIFLLMPLRHSNQLMNLQIVMDHVAKRSVHDGEASKLLDRFRKISSHKLYAKFTHFHQDLQAKSRWSGEMDDILERDEIKVDESGMHKEKLSQTVEATLSRTSKKRDSTEPLFISLSGGVDSMVLATIVQNLFPKHGRDVIGIHLDYGNRPESGAEAKFVLEWCGRHGIKCHARRIEEVSRANTPRDEYEKVSRDIRYNYYKEVLAMYNARDGSVMFGHHKGDVQENVISNIMKGSGVLDLSGMTEESVVNGVKIWRPLLSHLKSEIYDFAHRYGTPYFKDTTPKWSTRGKMRDLLLPLLTEMYGEGYLDNLLKIANESDQLHDFSQKTTFRPFYRTIRCTPVAVSMDFAEFLDMPPFFYNEVLKEVCHKCLGTGMVREKTVRTAILPRLQALRNMKVLEDGKAEASTDEPSSSSGLAPNSGVILDKSAQYGKKAQARYLRRKTEGMRKDCFITLRKESLSFFTEARLIIFRDGFKVGKKCDNSKSQEAVYPHTEKGTVIKLEQEYSFGPWRVSAALVREEDASPTGRGQYLSLTDVIKGEIVYCLPHADTQYIVDPHGKSCPIRGVAGDIKACIPFVVPADTKAAPVLQEDASDPKWVQVTLSCELRSDSVKNFDPETLLVEKTNS